MTTGGDQQDRISVFVLAEGKAVRGVVFLRSGQTADQVDRLVFSGILVGIDGELDAGYDARICVEINVALPATATGTDRKVAMGCINDCLTVFFGHRDAERLPVASAVFATEVVEVWRAEIVRPFNYAAISSRSSLRISLFADFDGVHEAVSTYGIKKTIGTPL